MVTKLTQAYRLQVKFPPQSKGIQTHIFHLPGECPTYQVIGFLKQKPIEALWLKLCNSSQVTEKPGCETLLVLRNVQTYRFPPGQKGRKLIVYQLCYSSYLCVLPHHAVAIFHWGTARLKYMVALIKCKERACTWTITSELICCKSLSHLTLCN